jgi:hypothetical protein
MPRAGLELLMANSEWLIERGGLGTGRLIAARFVVEPAAMRPLIPSPVAAMRTDHKESAP